MALPPIMQVSRDVLGLISYHAGPDVIALRATCKKLKDASKSAFEAYQRQLIVDRYGTRLESEKDIPLDVLHRRAKSGPQLRRTEKTADNFIWLEIDEDSVPKMVDYKTRFFGQKSFFELLKAKYQIFRREPDQDRNDLLQKLLSKQTEIASQLAEKPLDKAHPLEDLRNRNRRHETLIKQRDGLEFALMVSNMRYHRFLDNLSLIEKVLFYVVSFFHSFVKATYTETVAFPKLPDVLKTMNDQGVELCKTTIFVQNTLTQVEIRARLLFDNDDDLTNRINFYILNPNGIRLGSFAIERIQIDPDDRFDTELEKDRFFPKKPILFINWVKDDLGQDPENGNRPIMRLLTQLAIEIFQRESENTIRIVSRHPAHTDLLIAVGFKSVRNGKIDNEVQEVDRVRMLSGGYKPDLYLIKALNSDQTQFSSPDGNPALVNFQVNCEPITWEEQIRQNPLLSTTKGQILPKSMIPSMPFLD